MEHEDRNGTESGDVGTKHDAKAEVRAWAQGQVVGHGVWTVPIKEGQKRMTVQTRSTKAAARPLKKGSRIMTQQLKIKKCVAGDD